ncbi:uncharacterized protein LOC117116841, partial [Anneissia japonica]|uniref:uncharacterized protein LOC117116841 n=1 Tax=Anneissia japonica TaxID=1529436 RepID=UPI0014255398
LPEVSRHPTSKRGGLNTQVILYCKIEYSTDWQWFKDGTPLANSMNREELSLQLTISALGYYRCSGSGNGPHQNVFVHSLSAAVTVIGVSTFPVTLAFSKLLFTKSLQNPSSSDFQAISSNITEFLDGESLPSDPYVQVLDLREGSVVADTNFYVYNLNRLPKEYIDILLAALMEAGNNSNGFLNPDRIIINTAEMCFEQTIMGYTFPDTFVGETVDSKEECDETRKYYGQPVANNTCIGDGLTTAVWHPEPISNCGGEATAEDLLARIID